MLLYSGLQLKFKDKNKTSCPVPRVIAFERPLNNTGSIVLDPLRKVTATGVSRNKGQQDSVTNEMSSVSFYCTVTCMCSKVISFFQKTFHPNDCVAL